MNVEKWLLKNTHSLRGKTVAISGATGGLGREICKIVASLEASLCLLDRNKEKSLKLEQEIKALYPRTEIDRITLDLADFPSVKAAAERLLENPPDYLILNAGAYSIPRKICDTGYLNVFQINFVSPYFLARKLLKNIEKRGGKIIVVGSIAHNYSHVDTNDIDFSGRRRASLIYGNAKRFLMYSLLSIGSPCISVVHPGISFTGITAHYPKPIFAIIKHPMKLIFMKPRAACLSVILGIFNSSKGYEWIGPRFFDVWGAPERKPLRTAKQSEIDDICRISEEIYNRL